MIWLVKFEIGGGHVHCRLFAAVGENQTYARCGKFVVRKGAEFKSLVTAFKGARFISEDPECGLLEAYKP